MKSESNNNTIWNEGNLQHQPNLLTLIDDLKAKKLKPIDLAVYAVHQDEVRTYGETRCESASIANKIGKSEAIVSRSLDRLWSTGQIKDYIVEDDGRVIEIPREYLTGEWNNEPSPFQDSKQLIEVNANKDSLEIDDMPF